MTYHKITNSESETIAFGAKLARFLKAGDVIAFLAIWEVEKPVS